MSLVERYVPEPEQVCFACEGVGFLACRDTRGDRVNRYCWACGGLATAGVYVVRLRLDGRIDHEQRFHTPHMLAAMSRAARTARHISERGTWKLWPVEVRVLFLPHPKPQRCCPACRREMPQPVPKVIHEILVTCRVRAGQEVVDGLAG